MRVFNVLLSSTCKSKVAFKTDYCVDIIFRFLYIYLQVLIWRGLYGTKSNYMGFELNDLIIYTIMSSITQMLVRSTLMKDMNQAIQDGSIVTQLLLPIGYPKYQLLLRLSDNLFTSVYRMLPPIIVAIVWFHIEAQFTVLNVVYYFLATTFAIILNHTYNFIMGLSVMLFKNAFFLENIDELIFKVLSGAIVPIWFFPDKISKLSYYLPFRYMIFDPISIIMGTKTQVDTLNIIKNQILWLVILLVLANIAWIHAKKHIMVNGG